MIYQIIQFILWSVALLIGFTLCIGLYIVMDEEDMARRTKDIR